MNRQRRTQYVFLGFYIEAGFMSSVKALWVERDTRMTALAQGGTLRFSTDEKPVLRCIVCDDVRCFRY